MNEDNMGFAARNLYLQFIYKLVKDFNSIDLCMFTPPTYISSESNKSLYELEEDVKRLQNVAERFNKIGSGPELTNQRLEPILNNCIDYIERRLPRFSKNVTIKGQFMATANKWKAHVGAWTKILDKNHNAITFSATF